MTPRQRILAGTAPDGLSVGGWLDLSGTAIAALPDGLSVGGWLVLSGTAIAAWHGFVCEDDEYPLICLAGRYRAGCRNFSADEALAHWHPRSQSPRAAKFRAAILKREQEKLP